MNLPYPKYLSAAAATILLLTAGILFSGTFSGIYGDNMPKIDDCPPKMSTGDLECSVDNEDDSTISSEVFDLTAVDISGESRSPVDRFLYLNDYVKENEREKSFKDLRRNDFILNSSIQNRIEKASTCKARISDLTADSSTQFVLQSGEEMRWEDDDDQDDQAPSIVNLDFQPFTVSGDVKVLDNGNVRCQSLNFTEVVQKADSRVNEEVESVDVPYVESPGLSLQADLEIAEREQERSSEPTDESNEETSNRSQDDEENQKEESNNSQDSRDDQKDEPGLIQSVIKSVTSFLGGLI